MSLAITLYALSDYEVEDSVNTMSRENKIETKMSSSWHRLKSHVSVRDNIINSDKSVHLSPDSSVNYSSRGEIKRLQGDLPGALHDAELAISLDSENVMAYLIRAYIKLDTSDYYNEFNLDTEELMHAINIDPRAAELYVCRGMISLHYRDYQDAERFFDDAIKLNPVHPPAYFNRGLCAINQQNYNKAAEDFQQSLNTKCTDASNDYRYSSIYYYIPKTSDIFYYRGLAMFGMKEYTEALSDFDQAIALLEDDNLLKGDFFRSRALVKVELKDYAGAEADEQIAQQNTQK